MRRADPQDIFFVSVGDNERCLGVCMIYAHDVKSALMAAAAIAPKTEDVESSNAAATVQVIPRTEQEDGKVGPYVLGRWYTAEECKALGRIVELKP